MPRQSLEDLFDEWFDALCVWLGILATALVLVSGLVSMFFNLTFWDVLFYFRIF
jgi:hypothetical protein